jgi:hypothetical protein
MALQRLTYGRSGAASSAIPPPERGRSATPDPIGGSRVGVKLPAAIMETRAEDDPPPDSICFEAKQMLSTSPLQGEEWRFRTNALAADERTLDRIEEKRVE